MADPGNPQVFFAAERTLLAWVRSGLAVIGLGFVVARFGIFLTEFQVAKEHAPHLGSTLIGVCLVLLGSASVAMGAWQHARFCKSMCPSEIPRQNLLVWSVCFSGILAAIGILLAGYLLLRAIAV